MMNTSTGLVGTAVRYWKDFALLGGGTFIGVILLSPVAIAAIYTFYRQGIGFLMIAIVSLALHLGAMYVRDVRRDDCDPDESVEDSTDEILPVYLMLMGYFTPVLLLASIGSVQLRVITNSSFAALLFALYYPLVDFEIIKRYDVSLGGFPLAALFLVLHTVGLLRGISLDTFIEDFRRDPPMRYMRLVSG